MVFVTFFAAGGPISFSSGTRVFRAPGRGSLLLSAAKVTKNAVQICGLKIRSRPHMPPCCSASHADAAGAKPPEMWN